MKVAQLPLPPHKFMRPPRHYRLKNEKVLVWHNVRTIFRENRSVDSNVRSGDTRTAGYLIKLLIS
jgi:hypothetical protein